MIQVTATDGDKDRQQNIVYFLTGQGIDPDNPANSKFDINRTTGEIFVLKVSTTYFTNFNIPLTQKRRLQSRDSNREVCALHAECNHTFIAFHLCYILNIFLQPENQHFFYYYYTK